MFEPTQLKESIEMHVAHDVTGYPVFCIHGFSGAQKFDKQALEQYRQQLVNRYNSHTALVEALEAVNNALGHKFDTELADMVDNALAQAKGGA